MAKITIDGKFGDKDAVLTGEISDVDIDREVSFEGATSYFADRIFSNGEKITLRGTLKAYNIKLKDKKDLVDKVIDRVVIKVERSARVEVADSTIEAIDNVRKAVGVPKDAQFVIEPRNGGVISTNGNNIVLGGGGSIYAYPSKPSIKDSVPAPCIVKFTWTEDV